MKFKIFTIQRRYTMEKVTVPICSKCLYVYFCVKTQSWYIH